MCSLNAVTLAADDVNDAEVTLKDTRLMTRDGAAANKMLVETDQENIPNDELEASGQETTR